MLSNFDKNLTILTTRWFQNSLMREKESCNLVLLRLKGKLLKESQILNKNNICFINGAKYLLMKIPSNHSIGLLYFYFQYPDLYFEIIPTNLQQWC